MVLSLLPQSPPHAPFADILERQQVVVVALPEEDEGAGDVDEGEQGDTVDTSQEHYGQRQPVAAEEHHPLKNIQVRPVKEG